MHLLLLLGFKAMDCNSLDPRNGRVMMAMTQVRTGLLRPVGQLTTPNIGRTTREINGFVTQERGLIGQRQSREGPSSWYINTQLICQNACLAWTKPWVQALVPHKTVLVSQHSGVCGCRPEDQGSDSSVGPVLGYMKYDFKTNKGKHVFKEYWIIWK